MELSKRVASMQFSPIRKFNQYAIDAEKQGKKVYHLNIGQPDIKTPECFMNAVRKFNKPVVAYSESAGIDDLLDAIIEYNRIYDIKLQRSDIIAANGASEALSFIFSAILNPGDAAMIAEPYYANYATFCNSVSGRLLPVTTKAEDGYAWADRDLLEAAYSEEAKAICCVNPGNPTGRVLNLEEMRIIGEFAREHDLWIISDEVYREFTYDGRKPASFGQLPEYADRVIMVDSVSKRYSACGARIGAIISKNRDIMNGILKLAQGRLCVPTLEQIGAAALYRLDSGYLDNAREEYEARRNAAYEEISQIPGVVCQKPAGSFYMMVKLPIENAEDFLMFLLTEFNDNGETVMFAPAESFYVTPGKGRDEIRLAYVLKAEDMRRAAELIKLGLQAYKKKVI